MNGESVRAWFRDEAKKDIGRNPQNASPLTAIMGTSEKDLKWPRAETEQNCQWHRLKLPDRHRRAPDTWYDFHDQTVALVAHDVMIEKIVDYAIRYENELNQFKRILVTGTLGHEIENSCRILKEEGKIRICLSGPRGGNIEIATEVLFNRCNVVVIFVDALNPQPHIDDIRVIYGSCMAEIYNNDVRILTNEEQARDWIENTVKRHVP
jgi:methylglyoxal synthase